MTDAFSDLDQWAYEGRVFAYYGAVWGSSLFKIDDMIFRAVQETEDTDDAPQSWLERIERVEDADDQEYYAREFSELPLGFVRVHRTKGRPHLCYALVDVDTPHCWLAVGTLFGPALRFRQFQFDDVDIPELQELHRLPLDASWAAIDAWKRERCRLRGYDLGEK